MAVFNTVARFNHSCVPNVHNSWNMETKTETLYAVAPLFGRLSWVIAVEDSHQEKQGFKVSQVVLSWNQKTMVNNGSRIWSTCTAVLTFTLQCGTTGASAVAQVRDIAKGQELCTTYLNPNDLYRPITRRFFVASDGGGGGTNWPKKKSLVIHGDFGCVHEIQVGPEEVKIPRISTGRYVSGSWMM